MKELELQKAFMQPVPVTMIITSFGGKIMNPGKEWVTNYRPEKFFRIKKLWIIKNSKYN